MGKKLPFLISTLICLPALFGPVGTAAADTNATASMRYWTVEQLMEMDANLEAEKELSCAGDSACERAFYQELRMSDSVENGILDMFNNSRVIVSRVNPSTESIHLVYHDTDAMMREWGEVERQPLNEFHLVWLDSSMPDPMSDFSYMNNGHPLFVDEIHENNLSAGVHLLMTKSIARDGQAWISPNQEVAFTTDTDALSSNTTHKMYYAALIGTWQTHNYFDYGECLASPSYHPGMECRYVFYEDYTRGYLPFAVTTDPTNSTDPADPAADPATDPAAVSTSEITTSSSDTTNANPVISTSSVQAPIPTSGNETNYNLLAVSAQTPTSSAQTPTSPAQTSTSPASATIEDNSANDYVEVPLAAEPQSSAFPWWLIVFAFSGFAVVIFWFMLIRNRLNED